MSTTITTMTPEQRVSKLFELLEISGKKEHISGNMTQLDHALRVANLAKIDSADEDTTLAELILNAGKITVTIPPYGNFKIGDGVEFIWSGYDRNTINTFDSDDSIIPLGASSGSLKRHARWLSLTFWTSVTLGAWRLKAL
ncbi:hypothetical protein GGI16_007283 [Coemansia sp. S142-1]|nr:hypothetical protein GGI16_007283 [Coemansia sp. S142-1]